MKYLYKANDKKLYLMKYQNKANDIWNVYQMKHPHKPNELKIILHEISKQSQ